MEIPFEGRSLPGYFLHAAGEPQSRPAIIHIDGYDGNINEMYFAHGPAATRRGYHCLLFDGPGQGRNLIRDGLPLRPDWEVVVRAVVDYALTALKSTPSVWCWRDGALVVFSLRALQPLSSGLPRSLPIPDSGTSVKD